jgi:hypothetical protein
VLRVAGVGDEAAVMFVIEQIEHLDDPVDRRPAAAARPFSAPSQY